MKRVLVALTIASVFAACNGNQNQTAGVDTTAMKQRAIQEEQARIKAEKEEQAKIAAAERRGAARASAPVYYTQPAVGSSANQVATGSGSAVEQKQGMSSRAKGAIIGGVGGAIAGGLIGKNAKGAIIGGVAGAGTGYVIGRSKDKKTGRIPPKN